RQRRARTGRARALPRALRHRRRRPLRVRPRARLGRAVTGRAGRAHRRRGVRALRLSARRGRGFHRPRPGHGSLVGRSRSAAEVRAPMAHGEDTMMNPSIEELLERAGSKFALVTLSAKRAREINAYFNQLGEGLGSIVPPQVTSVARKPLSIAFEEIASDKIVMV